MDIFKNQKTITALEIIIFCILAFVIGSAQTVSPFYGDLNLIDEGQFAAWANQMLHGKLMYRDLYVTYGPLYVYALYILFKLFSPSAFLVRVYITLGSIIGIIGLNILMLNFEVKRIGRFLMNMLLILLPLIILRQASGFIAIYFLILTETKNNRLYSFFTGIFTTLTFLISPELGIIIGIIIILYLMYKVMFELDKSGTLKSFIYMLIGAVLPTMIFIFWAGVEGWLSDYAQTMKQTLIDFSGINVPNGQNLPNILTKVPSTNNNLFGWLKFFLSKELFIYYTMILSILMILFITVKVVLKKTTQIDKKIILILLYNLAFLYLFVGRPDFPHLFFGLSPLLLVLIYYFDKILTLYKMKNTKTSNEFVRLLVICLILLFFVRLLYINNPQIKKIAMIPWAVASSQTNPKFVGPILISESQIKYFRDLQNFIDNNTKIKDKIFILSDEPMLYLILNRDNATKYVLPYLADLKPMRNELVREIKNNKPKFILYNRKVWSVDNISNLIRLPEAIQYINQNYSEFKTIDNVKIYKLN